MLELAHLSREMRHCGASSAWRAPKQRRISCDMLPWRRGQREIDFSNIDISFLRIFAGEKLGRAALVARGVSRK